MSSPQDTKVLFRFDEEKEDAVKKWDLDLREKEPTWTPEMVRLLKAVLPSVETGSEGQFKVKANFTALARSLGVTKQQIYRKLVQLYHEETVKPDKSLGSEKEFSTSTLAGTARTPLITSSFKSHDNSRIGTAGQSLLERLQRLKLGSEVNVQQSIEASQESTTESEGSEASVINLASASVYLQSSRLVESNAKGKRHDSEDYLLTSDSVHDSLLEEEILKRL